MVPAMFFERKLQLIGLLRKYLISHLSSKLYKTFVHNFAISVVPLDLLRSMAGLSRYLHAFT